jgi:hypothetical protein
MKKLIVGMVVGFTAFVVLALMFPPNSDRVGKPIENLPWQIETLPGGGSKVFGITLGKTTVGEVRQRFGPDMQLAVIAAPKETGALEAYYGDFTAGVLIGKLIVGTSLDAAAIERLRDRAVKSEFMQSTTRRYRLRPDDLAEVHKLPVTALTFIPMANIDEPTALRHFGTPRERLRTDEHVEHLMYPEKGLDLALDSEGKEVLQYVAPRDFARLREPVVKAVTDSGQKPN